MLLSKVYKATIWSSTRFLTGGHQYIREKQENYIRAENPQRLKGLAKLEAPGNVQHSRLKIKIHMKLQESL